MSDPELLLNLVADVERDVKPLLRRVVDELAIDDEPTLIGLGSMFSEAWMAGSSARDSETVCAALDAGVAIDGDAVRAMADSVRPAITIDDVVGAIAARSAESGATGGAATRKEIAKQLGVSDGEISREGRDPDGPLGRAVARGYVAAHPHYQGYWLLTPTGLARVSA